MVFQQLKEYIGSGLRLRYDTLEAFSVVEGASA